MGVRVSPSALHLQEVVPFLPGFSAIWSPIEFKRHNGRLPSSGPGLAGDSGNQGSNCLAVDQPVELEGALSSQLEKIPRYTTECFNLAVVMPENQTARGEVLGDKRGIALAVLVGMTSIDEDQIVILSTKVLGL